MNNQAIKRMGRPKLSQEKLRKAILTLRVKEDELRNIHEAASKAGLSPSEWIRKALRRALTDDIS